MTAENRVPNLVPRDQRWFYHPEMQARVAQAEAEFRDGRCTYTTTLEEAQEFLELLKTLRAGT